MHLHQFVRKEDGVSVVELAIMVIGLTTIIAVIAAVIFVLYCLGVAVGVF